MKSFTISNIYILTIKDDYMSLERFMKVFTSLPLPERELTVVVIENQPVSWNRAYTEIKNDTKRGKAIQKKLEELDII
jgi:hypothetical protein